jgi:tetratricopeptide (TPR) repeat protein
MTERQRVVSFWSTQRAAMRAMKVDGDLEGAITLFEEALALDPTHEDSRYYLGNCLAAIGETGAAVGQLEELLRRDPRSHRTLRRLGILRAMTAQSPAELSEAMAYFDRALAVNREETGVLLAMGEIHLIMREYDEAEQRLEWACRTNPRAVSGFFLRGYLAWNGGDADSARELLAAALVARGDEWKPQGTTAEGDVAQRMHVDATPLSESWNRWSGTLDPDEAYASLDAFLERHAARPGVP